eukprot:5705180-Pyramimonas_sp.AAC.1
MCAGSLKDHAGHAASLPLNWAGFVSRFASMLPHSRRSSPLAGAGLAAAAPPAAVSCWSAC